MSSVDVGVELKSSNSRAFQAGIEQYRLTLRLNASLMMFLGCGCLLSSQAPLSEIIMGNTGSVQIEGFGLLYIVTSLYQMIIGLNAVIIGFSLLLATPTAAWVYKLLKSVLYFNRLLTLVFVVIVPASFSKSDGNGFASSSSARFEFALGIINTLTVRFQLLGGLNLIIQNALALLSGQAVDKHRGFYMSQLVVYSSIMFLSGFSQCLAGLHLGFLKGWLAYDEAVTVGFCTVFFPVITVFVGTCQMMYGSIGIIQFVEWKRKWSLIPSRHDNSIVWAGLIVALVTFTLQILLQNAWAPGKDHVADSATFAAAYFGCFVMIPFLDYNVRTTPSKIEPRLYSLPEDTKCIDGFFNWLFGTNEGQAPETQNELELRDLHPVLWADPSFRRKVSDLTEDSMVDVEIGEI
jgi:hypothetical protein